ncbi:MAG TPA: inositol monophosphatase family protein [Gemmataceae bacterium]|nr:inositol monophosphatase family protein [Gemmataceae bacterium]
MSFERELQAALEAADRAGRELERRYAAFVAIPDAPASISTDADRVSQEIILGLLRREFPGDALCAEEATPTLAGAARTGPRLWVVDPIDGTRGFARKNGEFSVMVGFVHEGQIAVGVVLEPAPGRLTYAVRGEGCWRRDRGDAEAARCRVTAVPELSAATLVQSHAKTPGGRSRWVEALKPARVTETYSAGVKLARVARGEADLYLNTYPNFHDWDSCAGQVLVEEAGGRVTGLRGEGLRYGLPGADQKHGLLASNGLLHDAALRALAPLVA